MVNDEVNNKAINIEIKVAQYSAKAILKAMKKIIEYAFYAFKDYADRRKINWGVVRDKDTRLYINNTNYTKEMNNENCKRLEDLF